MKRIMIIGAGEAQIPLIESAKNCGYYTIVCDMNPDAPGTKIANEFFCVSTKDRDMLLETAKNNSVDGIVANSEYAMRDVAYISTKLGLVGNDERSIGIFSSKNEFRALQKKIGIYSPLHIELSEQEQIEEYVDKMKFPIIIKPSESSGTRGTTKISNKENLEEIKSSFLKCREFSRNGCVTIEEYVEMTSNAVIEGEVFVHKGEFLWDGLFTTIRSKKANMIPMTYMFPVDISEELRKKAITVLKALFVSAEIKHGEYNVELYFNEQGNPFVIEINVRQGGNFLPRYVYEHCGIDMYKLLVTTSVGDDSYWNEIRTLTRNDRYIVHHVLYPRETGEFLGLAISKQIEKNIKKQKLDVVPGTMISKTIDAASEIGFIDLEFDSLQEQRAVCDDIESYIKICVK